MARSSRSEAERQLEVALSVATAAQKASDRAREQVRLKAVKAVLAGCPKGEVARRLGVHPTTLNRFAGMPAHHNVARSLGDRRLKD